MYTTGRCARAASDSEKIGKKLKKMEKTEINQSVYQYISEKQLIFPN